MKKLLIIPAALALLMTSCNSESKRHNEEKSDTSVVEPADKTATDTSLHEEIREKAKDADDKLEGQDDPTMENTHSNTKHAK